MNYYKLSGEIGANLHIRPGNRGGRALFDWEEVRSKRYVQRQVYLGASSKIGVLDKGGVFRKGDWWNNNPTKKQATTNSFSKAKQAQKKRFEKAFSTEKPSETKRQVLSRQQINEILNKQGETTEKQQQPEQRCGLGYRAHAEKESKMARTRERSRHNGK